MKKKLVYVSGKYRDGRGTAYVEQNIRSAEAVAQQLWAMGFAVICPHSNTRHFDGIVDSEDFIAGDLVMVERCDAVVMLPAWQHSEGACLEHEHAKVYGVPVYYWPAEIQHLEKFVELPLHVRVGRIAG